MNVIDYRGYRLIASSLLPIGGDSTLVYGSRDGGKTIKTGKNVPKIEESMEKVSRKLFLKMHTVALRRGSSQLGSICTGSDVEIHHGYDGLYYALDCKLFFKSPENLLKLQLKSR